MGYGSWTTGEVTPMALAIIPILLIVVGILIYFVTANDRAREVGRACFWAGFIGLAIGYSQHMIRIGS